MIYFDGLELEKCEWRHTFAYKKSNFLEENVSEKMEQLFKGFLTGRLFNWLFQIKIEFANEYSQLLLLKSAGYLMLFY